MAGRRRRDVIGKQSDHFSPEDIRRVRKQGTKLVVPKKMRGQVSEFGIEEEDLHTIAPGEHMQMDGMTVEAVAAYNNLKPFHPKKNGWVGYLLHFAKETIYIAGDTDLTKESRQVVCDVAMVPIGGTYTMDAKKTAELVNIIKPKIAISIHYGSVAGSREDEEVFCKLVDADIYVEIKMQRY